MHPYWEGVLPLSFRFEDAWALRAVLESVQTSRPPPFCAGITSMNLMLSTSPTPKVDHFLARLTYGDQDMWTSPRTATMTSTEKGRMLEKVCPFSLPGEASGDPLSEDGGLW